MIWIFFIIVMLIHVCSTSICFWHISQNKYVNLWIYLIAFVDFMGSIIGLITYVLFLKLTS